MSRTGPSKINSGVSNKWTDRNQPAVPVSTIQLTDRFIARLLLVVFSGFGDVGMVTCFGHSLQKRVCACGS